MTTDNRTNEPTAEQVVSETLGPYGLIGRARDLAARNAVERLRANGLLSEGAPSEEQARAIRKLDNVQAILAGAQASVTDAVRELSLTSAALTAAGVASQEVIDDAADEQDDLRLHMLAPQEPSQNETKSGNNFVSLDPEKVAEVIEQMRDRARKERDVTKESLGQFIARALCEAYTEGKLT